MTSQFWMPRGFARDNASVLVYAPVAYCFVADYTTGHKGNELALGKPVMNSLDVTGSIP